VTLPTAYQLNYLNHQIVNKLAKLLPVLSIVLSIPALAVVAHIYPHDIADRRQSTDVRVAQIDNLNLTTAQKIKMDKLRQSEQIQIERVLTIDQRQKFQQIESQHHARQQAGEGLNLTSDQKSKLNAIHQSDLKQFQSILTAAQQAQLKQDDSSRGKGASIMRPDKLNLTPSQKAKLEQFRSNGQAQMEAILTPEQRQKAQMMRNRPPEMDDTWKSINLTADQKTKIKTIHQASKQQLDSILTPEQQAKLKLKAGNHRHTDRFDSFA
jgi:Spy/CpxP family protein refolding chaperone